MVGAGLEVEVHDGEAVAETVPVEGVEDGRRHQVDAGEGELAAAVRVNVGERAAHLPRRDVGPSLQPVVFVKKEIPLRFPLAHHQRGQCPGPMLLPKPPQVQIADNVHVMDEERFVIPGSPVIPGASVIPGLTGNLSLQEQRRRVLDSPACLAEEIPLVGNGDAGTKVVGMKIMDDLVGEVVDVHHDVIIPRRHEFGDDVI